MAAQISRLMNHHLEIRSSLIMSENMHALNWDIQKYVDVIVVDNVSFFI